MVEVSRDRSGQVRSGLGPSDATRPAKAGLTREKTIFFGDFRSDGGDVGLHLYLVPGSS